MPQPVKANLPPMPQGLTAQWLSTALGAHGALPQGAAVSTVRRSEVGEGVGMMSELCRLHLDYSGDAPGAPASLIAKYPSQNPTNRAVAMSYNLYEREVRYFKEIDPLTTARAPPAYALELDGDNFLILMQDMGDYRVGDQAIGATLADSEAALDALARLHAPFWQNVAHLDWVPHVANSYHANNMRSLAADGWDNMTAIFKDFLPVPVAAMKQQFLNALPGLQAQMDAAPITFAHGDFRMANLLYAAAPQHCPLVILDWQGPLLGRGLFDVALFLGQSTQTEVRRAHERTLLQRYLDGLAELGVVYPFTQAWEHYRIALLHAWNYAAVVAGALDASDGRAFAWMSQMIARQAAATEDLHLRRLLADA